MIKEEILGQFLIDWFLKSQRPKIFKDITMMAALSEEEVILTTQ